MIAIVSHDAGGADLLSSWVAANPGNFCFVLAGPAVDVFRRRLGDIDIIPLELAIAQAESLICSTSWGSDLEWTAIGLANSTGMRTVAVVDHWVNYQERFVRSPVLHLPDEIWVADPTALRIAAEAFPGLIIVEIENLALAEFVAKVRELSPVDRAKAGEYRALFLGENLSANAASTFGDPHHFGYDELSSFRHFIGWLQQAGLENPTVRLRPHPSETVAKYLDVLGQVGSERSRFHVSGTSLAEDVAWSDGVFGISSMAMVNALAAGRTVYCCIPDPSIESPLPFDSIIRLSGP